MAEFYGVYGAGCFDRFRHGLANLRITLHTWNSCACTAHVLDHAYKELVVTLRVITLRYLGLVMLH